MKHLLLLFCLTFSLGLFALPDKEKPKDDVIEVINFDYNDNLTVIQTPSSNLEFEKSHEFNDFVNLDFLEVEQNLAIKTPSNLFFYFNINSFKENNKIKRSNTLKPTNILYLNELNQSMCIAEVIYNYLE